MILINSGVIQRSWVRASLAPTFLFRSFWWIAAHRWFELSLRERIFFCLWRDLTDENIMWKKYRDSGRQNENINDLRCSFVNAAYQLLLIYSRSLHNGRLKRTYYLQSGRYLTQHRIRSRTVHSIPLCNPNEQEEHVWFCKDKKGESRSLAT